MLEFEQFATLCWQCGSMLSPGELQGYLLGQLSHARPISQDDWLAKANQLLDPVTAITDEQQDLLLQFYKEAHELLEQGDMSVKLLLPDDDLELDQRIDCLGLLCQAFLRGFAEQGKLLQQQGLKRQFPEMVAESLNDIAAIAQVALEDDEENNANAEQYFFSISEHVRMAIVTIFLECVALENSPSVESAKPTLH